MISHKNYTYDNLKIPANIYYSKNYNSGINRLALKGEKYRTRTATHKIGGGTWGKTTRLPYQTPYYTGPLNRIEFRCIDKASDILRNIPLGWYCDIYQDETISGYVFQFPSRGNDTYYFPGLVYSNQDDVTLYPLDQYETKEECAAAADNYAQHRAEDERDYSAQDAAEMDIENCKEDIKACRETVKQIITAWRITSKKCGDMPATISAIINKQIEENHAELRVAIKTIKERRENYWTAAPY